MAQLAFRNVDASPAEPVERWPYEGLVAAIERGQISHWARIARSVRRDPWGQVARDVEAYAQYGDDDGVISLLMESIRRARAQAERAERAEVARRVREAIALSGLSAERFAKSVGTSASRLSTYRSGAVTPSAAMLVRIERAGSRAALPDKG